jgi:hypothetical protein
VNSCGCLTQHVNSCGCLTHHCNPWGLFNSAWEFLWLPNSAL